MLCAGEASNPEPRVPVADLVRASTVSGHHWVFPWRWVLRVICFWRLANARFGSTWAYWKYLEIKYGPIMGHPGDNLPWTMAGTGLILGFLTWARSRGDSILDLGAGRLVRHSSHAASYSLLYPHLSSCCTLSHTRSNYIYNHLYSCPVAAYKTICRGVRIDKKW